MNSLPKVENESRVSERKGPLVPLWEGDNLALHTSLLQALDAARIPYYTNPLGIYPGVRRSDQFPIQPLMRFGYKVAVLRSDSPAAEKILNELIEEGPKDLVLSDEAGPVSTFPLASNTDEPPSFEIWSDEDKNFADFLVAALTENQITLRSDIEDHENRIFVRPSDSARAKEIVRELTDSSPPQ